MKAYSLDLRERVIAMLQEGKFSQPHIAEHFRVSLGTVENWWRLWRKTGSWTRTTSTAPGRVAKT